MRRGIRKGSRWAFLALAGLVIQDRFGGLDIDGGWLVAVTVLLILAALTFALTFEPAAEYVRLPIISAKHSPGGGLMIHVRRPARAGFSDPELIEATHALVSDMAAYTRETLNARPHHLVAWTEQRQAQAAAKSEEEQAKIWNDYVENDVRQHEADRNELTARFGGRVSFLTREFDKRGLVSDYESSPDHLMWMIGSFGFLHEAAAHIEQMAHALAARQRKRRKWWR
jgi:hypothetical protein